MQTELKFEIKQPQYKLEKREKERCDCTAIHCDVDCVALYNYCAWFTFWDCRSRSTQCFVFL